MILFGEGQQLIFQNTTITLDADAFVYGQSDHDDWSRYMGYVRYRNPKYEQQHVYNSAGYSQFKGAEFRPHEFYWTLQNLNSAIAELLLDGIEDCIANQRPARLIDYRQAYQEAPPRTRAKKGVLLLDTPTLIKYWAQFQIMPKLEKPEIIGNKYNLTFTAQEFNPGFPVAIAEDL